MKGIVYIMNTAVSGLIKIGKTGSQTTTRECDTLSVMDIITFLG